MKRRNFLKGIAALALAPAAVLAQTSTSPAKVEPPYGTEGKGKIYQFNGNATEMIARTKEAMVKMGESSEKARHASEELRKSLDDLFISPETMQDIRDWGVDQVDEKTRSEIYAYSMPGAAVLDNRKVLLADMGEPVEAADGDYQIPELSDGPLMITGWGFDDLDFNTKEGTQKLAKALEVPLRQSIRPPEPQIEPPVDLEWDDEVKRLVREELFELGPNSPYHKYVNFPVEVKEKVHA